MAQVAVLDVARLLDESAMGKARAAQLKSAWLQKRDQYDRAMKSLGASALDPSHVSARELAQMDAEAQEELGGMRAEMIRELLEAARPLVVTICSERKIELVLDAQAAFHVGDPALDLTGETIKRLDASGKT